MLNNIPEKLLRSTIEKLLPLLAFFLFLALVGMGLMMVTKCAWSAPFLVCDPYDSSAVQPTEFVVTISGIQNPIVTPAVDVTGGKAMKLDLGPLNLTGTRTVTAKARNLWGVSADSSPFLFTATPPGSLTGITLSATE